MFDNVCLQPFSFLRVGRVSLPTSKHENIQYDVTVLVMVLGLSDTRCVIVQSVLRDALRCLVLCFKSLTSLECAISFILKG